MCSDSSVIKYGVEDVPPSDPVLWERDAVVSSHDFGTDPHRGFDPRVAAHHHPLEQWARSIIELHEMVHVVVLEESVCLLGKHPEDIDPSW